MQAHFASQDTWHWQPSSALCPRCKTTLLISLHNRTEAVDAVKCPQCKILTNIAQQARDINIINSPQIPPNTKADALQRLIDNSHSFPKK